MNRAAVALDHSHRVGGIRGGEDDIALRLERAAAQREHGRLVLDDENRLGPAIRTVLRWARLDWRRRVDAGEIDLEAGAASNLGINRDVAIALLYDPVDRGEPQSRPFADLLGCEKRLEEMRADHRVHADTCVGHGDHRIRSGHGAEVRLCVCRIELYGGRFDRQLPPVGHRVARVARWKIPEEELRVAEDGGEQVVEIVGDATRELTDGFHLLRLPELLFEMPLFADVALGTPDTHQPSLLDEADDVIKEDAGPPVPRLLARLRVGQAVSGTDE